MAKVMRAIIVGGGIGGAATALSLARQGIKVMLLEKAHEIGEIGAGIQLAPNAFAALDALGRIGPLEILTGDIRDPATVSELLTGCDAALHAAGVVGTDSRRTQLMWDINAYATEALLTRACELGLDPVVSTPMPTTADAEKPLTFFAWARAPFTLFSRPKR